MPNNHGNSRLNAARRTLTHLHERLGLDFGFELWDGSTIPAEPNGAKDLRPKPGLSVIASGCFI
jgi:hypothetical protein